MQEIFKKITGYENYEVSNLGRVRNIKTNKFLIQKNDRDYRSVALTYKPGFRKSFRVHRLVALSFIDNPENKPQINHRDGIKSNNNVDNLEWSTASENMLHAYSIGLMKKPIGHMKGKKHSEETKEKIRMQLIGEKNPNSKLKSKDAIEIRRLYKNGYKRKQLEILYNVGQSCIYRITKNLTYKGV